MRRPASIRLLAPLFVAALAAPVTWLRSSPQDDFRPILSLEPVEVEQTRTGELAIEGLWELRSTNSHFGSYSALLAMADGRLLAGSDRGRFLRFAPPGAAPRQPEFGAIGGGVEERKYAVDVEALAGDPAGGHIWAAYEGSNAIVRFGPELADGESVSPQAMREWSSNGGPESLARLADGRFLVIEEGAPDWSRPTHAALLFPGDPVAGAEPIRFRYAPPEGYRPVDAAPLPDGRVLILHRRVTLGLPYAFEGIVSVADPHAVRAGETWRGREIGRIASPLPRDNFEGMAAVPLADGSLTIWLISDDNNAAFQRTLLYRLRWTP